MKLQAGGRQAIDRSANGMSDRSAGELQIRHIRCCNSAAGAAGECTSESRRHAGGLHSDGQCIRGAIGQRIGQLEAGGTRRHVEHDLSVVRDLQASRGAETADTAANGVCVDAAGDDDIRDGVRWHDARAIADCAGTARGLSLHSHAPCRTERHTLGECKGRGVCCNAELFIGAAKHQTRRVAKAGDRAADIERLGCATDRADVQHIIRRGRGEHAGRVCERTGQACGHGADAHAVLRTYRNRIGQRVGAGTGRHVVRRVVVRDLKARVVAQAGDADSKMTALGRTVDDHVGDIGGCHGAAARRNRADLILRLLRDADRIRGALCHRRGESEQHRTAAGLDRELIGTLGENQALARPGR